MVVNEAARHIVVLRRGQFCTYNWSFSVVGALRNLVLLDWFDVLDEENRPLLTEREVLRNLQAIVQDADKTPITEVRHPSINITLCHSSSATSRLLVPPSASSRPKTARLGLGCAKRSQRTEQMPPA